MRLRGGRFDGLEIEDRKLPIHTVIPEQMDDGRFRFHRYAPDGAFENVSGPRKVDGDAGG